MHYNPTISQTEMVECALDAFLRVRSYDPTVGRFLSTDPYGGDPMSPLTLHRYAYVEGNPINLMDPTGMFSIVGALNTMSLQTFMFATRFAVAYPAVITTTQTILTFTTIASLLLSEEARINFLSTGDPVAAIEGLAADTAYTIIAGANMLRTGSSFVSRMSSLVKMEPELEASARNIRAIASDAVVGFRGSMATGRKFDKIARKPGDVFNPTNFDLDAFIVSDKLATQMNSNKRFLDGRKIDGIGAEADKIEQMLQAFPGYRVDPKKPFTYRIYSQQQFNSEVANGTFMITGGANE